MRKKGFYGIRKSLAMILAAGMVFASVPATFASAETGRIELAGGAGQLVTKDVISNAYGSFYTLSELAGGGLSVSYNKTDIENWDYLKLDLSGVDRSRYVGLIMTVIPARDGMVMGVTDDTTEIYLRDHWSAEGTFSGTSAQDIALDLTLAPNAQYLCIWCDAPDSVGAVGAQSFVISGITLVEGDDPDPQPQPTGKAMPTPYATVINVPGDYGTIQAAVNAASSKTTIRVAAGTYKEQVSITKNEIALVGDSGAKLSGSGITPSWGKEGMINIKGKNVTVSGFEITGLYTTVPDTAGAKGIAIKAGSENVWVDSCKVHDLGCQYDGVSKKFNAHGIWLQGTDSAPSKNITVNACEVCNLHTGRSESVTLTGNIVGFSISNNSIHDNDNIGIDSAGFWQDINSDTDCSRDGEICGNIVYNISSEGNPGYDYQAGGADGIYVDGGQRVNIYDNIVYNCNIGLEVACENHGRSSKGCRVYNNTLINNDAYANLVIGGNSPSENGKAEENYFYNNTIVCGGWSNGIAIQTASGNDIRDNLIIVQGSAKGYSEKNGSNSQGNTVTHNASNKAFNDSAASQSNVLFTLTGVSVSSSHVVSVTTAENIGRFGSEKTVINGSSGVVPTNTPKPTATNTPKPTATNTPAPTATNTPVPTATNTPVPTTDPSTLPVIYGDYPDYVTDDDNTTKDYSVGDRVVYNGIVYEAVVNIYVASSNTITRPDRFTPVGRYGGKTEPVSNGWVKESGKWYYYKNGDIVTGWQKSGGKWYYLDPAKGGAMAKGWQKADGKWYYLGTDGAMQTGMITDGGKTYICKSSGELVLGGWIQIGSYWYCTNASGVMKQNAWQKSGGKWYYLGSDGRMVTGTTMLIDGVYYTFDQNGAMK